MPPLEILQYSHGVLTLGSDQSQLLTDPLPSYNPALEDLPANPYDNAATKLDDSHVDEDTGGVQVSEDGHETEPDTTTEAEGTGEGTTATEVPAETEEPAEGANGTDAEHSDDSDAETK